MPDDELLPDTLEALSQALAASGSALPARPEPLTLEAVRAFLIERIAALLDGNPALLMHVLYRVDVAEREVRRVFAERSPADVPGDLADLLIERQLQKLRTRRRYRAPDS